MDSRPKSFNFRLILPVVVVLICLSSNLEVEAGRVKRDVTVTDPATQTEYMIVTSERLTWTEALAACENQSGWTLASIDSTAEQVFLKSQLDPLASLSVWTSGTRSSPSEPWTWITTGCSILQESWGAGQPDDEEDNNCGALWKARNWLLSNIECSEVKFNYICKRPKVVHTCPTTTTETPTTTTEATTTTTAATTTTTEATTTTTETTTKYSYQ